MPQPYKGAFSCSPDALEDRPELARHIGVIASMWTYLELQLVELLSAMLNIEAPLATVMCVAIRNDGARDAAIKAAAEYSLNETELGDFEDVIEKMKTPRKQRNDVVHGLWGITRNSKSKLIWIDPRLAASFHAHLSKLTKPYDRRLVTSTNKITTKMFGAIMAYTEQDFLEIEAKIKEAEEALSQFRWNVLQQQSE